MAVTQEKDQELSADRDYYGRSHMKMLGDPDFKTWLRSEVRATDPRNNFTSNFAFYMVNVAKASRAAFLDDSSTCEKLSLVDVLQNIHSAAEAREITDDLNKGCKTAIQRAHDRDGWLDYVAGQLEDGKLNAQIGFHAQIVWRVYELSMRRKPLTPIAQPHPAHGEFIASPSNLFLK